MCISAQMHVFIYIHIYIHTCIHTYIHTYMFPHPFFFSPGVVIGVRLKDVDSRLNKRHIPNDNHVLTRKRLIPPRGWALPHGPVYRTRRVRTGHLITMRWVWVGTRVLNWTHVKQCWTHVFEVLLLSPIVFVVTFFLPPKWTVQSLPWVIICCRSLQTPVLVMCDRGKHVGYDRGKHVGSDSVLVPTPVPQQGCCLTCLQLTGLLYPMTSSPADRHSVILDNTQPHQVQPCGRGWERLWGWTKDRVLLSGELKATRMSRPPLKSQKCPKSVHRMFCWMTTQEHESKLCHCEPRETTFRS
jgi:hypothetical protein